MIVLILRMWTEQTHTHTHRYGKKIRMLCTEMCPFSHSIRCWISPMSDAGGRKPGVAGSHCACRWYLQSLQVSNSHWKCKKNTLDTCWHMESWWIQQDLKIFERDHEFVWISEAETNDALLDAKSTLSERAASLCFFNPYQLNQQFWKVMQRIIKENIRNFIHLSFLQRHNYYVFTICWHYVLHQFVASKSKDFGNPRSLKSSGHRVMRRFV